MAHEITNTDNVVLAKVAAWHGLGTVVEEAPSIAGALMLAGLDWRVEQHDLTTTRGKMIETHTANVRSDTGDVLGIVGTGYTPFQNAELADFAEALMSAGAKVESAGSIRGGKRVWFLIRTAEVVRVGDNGADEVRPYVLLANGHDGSLAFWTQPTSVRVVCSNTFHLALRDRKEAGKVGKALRLRHTSGIINRVEEARKVLDAHGIVVAAFQKEAEALARKQLEFREIRDYFTSVYDAAFTAPDSERGKTRRRNVLDAWIDNMEDRRQLIAGIRGTSWAAFNAVSQWSDHENGADTKTRDERQYAAWFGSGVDLKATAYEKALAMV